MNGLMSAVQFFLRFWRALLQVVDGLMMPTTST
jgi:hypothetical protein